MSETQQWQSIQNIGVYATETEDEVILFNPVSGETHQISLLALDALEFMQQPATFSQLMAHISDLYQTPADQELNLQLQSLIAQFDDIGLIHTLCQ